MLKQVRLLTVITACLIGFCLHAQSYAAETALTEKSTSLQFADSNGELWQRWILTEAGQDKTLLMVVENPVRHNQDDVVSQRLVFRHEFLNSHPENLANAIKKYRSLKDYARTAPAPWIEQPEITHEPLWVPTRNQWTTDDEKDYSAWYTANVDTRLLVGSGVIVDCAKFATAVRWIYAHDHLLPVANSLAATGKLVGQWSGTSDWDKLKTDKDWHKDQRFKTALQYILDHIYTHSIFNDLYPTELSQTYVNPGSILLILYSQSTGHTEVVNTLGPNDYFCPNGSCISVIYGNEPAAEYAYNDLAWIVNGGQTEGGFMRWRWPHVSKSGEWSLTAGTDMPGYSLDQYQYPKLNDSDFAAYVFSKLGLEVTDTENAVAIGNAMMGQLYQRLQLTAMGYFNCSVQKCAPTDALYDDYSTPSHDNRFRQNQAQFLNYLKTADLSDESLKNFLSSAHTTLFPENSVTYYDYLMNTNGVSDVMSSDPTVSFNSRWSLSGKTDLATSGALASAWQQALLSREVLVLQAVYMCYPHSPNKFECNAQDPKLKALNTNRLDLSLQKSRASLNTVFLKSSSSSQINKDANMVTNTSACSWEDNYSCTVEDFLYSKYDLIDSLSSDPTVYYYQRWGAKNPS